MFRKLKKFHEKTMEEYKKDLEKEMDPWKKKVLKIHEEAGFLFYMEEIVPEDNHGLCTVRGELVKNQGGLHKGIIFLNGEGKRLANAVIRSHPEEKEESGRRFLKKKLHEFKIQLMDIENIKVDMMENEEFNRLITNIIIEGSLVVDKNNTCMED